MSCDKKRAAVNVERIADITECPICLKTLKEPKCLPCIHTFCLECLKRYGADERDGDKMPCPVCREMFTIPEGGFEQTPKNCFLEELTNRAAGFTKRARLACQLCAEESSDKSDESSCQVSKYCVDCDQNMCEICAKSHTRMQASLSHKVISSDDSQESAVLIRNRPSYCETHEMEQIKLHCNDCERPICTTCKTLYHEGHAVTDLKQASEKFTAELREDLLNLKDCSYAIGKDQDQVDEDEEYLIRKISDVTEQISETYEMMLSVIKNERDQLLEELSSFKEKRLKEIQAAKDEVKHKSKVVQSLQKYAEELLERGSSCNIVSYASEIQQKSKDFVKCMKASEYNMTTKYHVYFTKADLLQKVSDGQTRLIGHIDERYDKQCWPRNLTVIHIVPYVRGIATLDSQLFIVRNGSQQIDIYNTSNYTAIDHLTLSGMEYPYSLVACSHYNCLYVSDWTGSIYRVELSDRSVTKWTVKGGPYGLSLTTAHCIVVTLHDDKRIQEYTTRGELLREIRLEESIVNPWQSVELSNGQFVVCHGLSDASLHRVCVVDTEGLIVRSYGRARGSAAGQLHLSCCLVVDNSDHIFVVDYNNSKIRLFSPTLTHLGDVIVPGYQLETKQNTS